jgi:membrane protease YdiL (CAAX protease family)
MSSSPPPSADRPAPVPARPELPEGVWRPDPPKESRSWERRVPLWAPFAIALATFVLASVAYSVIISIAGLSLEEADNAPGPLLGATFVQDLLLIGGAVLAAERALSSGAADALGLRRTRIPPAIGWAAAVFGAFWLVNGVLVAIFGAPPEQEITEEIKSESAFLALAGYISITCLMAPLAEEIFFRGLLFPVLRSRMGLAWGVVVTGALFSLVHAVGSPVEALIVLFVLGSGLCLLYVRTGSLLPCIGLHALNNSISFVVTKEMEWTLAVITVLGSVLVTVAIGLAFARRAGAATAAA